jgi:hypothetical protein
MGKGGTVFCQVFLLSLLQCKVKNCRTCKRLREFEEIEISRQVTVNNKEENSVWISSKNSAPEIADFIKKQKGNLHYYFIL